MLSQNQAKYITALHVKKYRQKYRKFIVEGEKIVDELLAQQRLPIEAVLGLDRWATARPAVTAALGTRFTPVTESELKRISTLQTPNQVLAVAALPERAFEPEHLPQRYCFFVDGLQDPGNLGTMLRIADWFGHPALFCSPDSVDAYNSKVVQAAMGAFLRVPVWEIALDALSSQLPGWPVLGAVLGGTDVFEAVLPGYGLVVIGREGRGIGETAESLLSHRITIPRGAGGGAESLNAGVAAGIIAAVLENRR